MMNNSWFRISPPFLKKIDSLFGRLAVVILPRPRKEQIPNTFATILIIRPGGIGDAALVAPLITSLLEKYPSARIDILAEARNAGIFCLIPGINNLFLYDRPAELLKVVRGKYDLVIDTEQWHRLSAVIARLSSAGFSIGFATNERRRLFSSSVPYSHEQYEAQSFLNLLTPLGMLIHFNAALKFLALPVNAAENIEKLPESRYVTIFPGASIAERLWGTDKFRRLAALFREVDILPVVVGGKAEMIAGDEIIAHGGVNFAGRTTLAGSAYLISRSILLVSGDSGILHVGTGLGIPTVSLFGPGISAKWGPIRENSAVIDKGLHCSPCTRFGYTPNCPDHVRCMKDISVEEVFSVAIALLNKTEFSASIPVPIAGQGGEHGDHNYIP